MCLSWSQKVSVDSIALFQFKHVYCVVTVNTCVHECGCCGVTFLFVLHALVCTSGCGSENQSAYACAWACVRVYTDGVCMHKKRVKSDGRFQLSTGAQPQNESVELIEDFNEVSPTFLLATPAGRKDHRRLHLATAANSSHWRSGNLVLFFSHSTQLASYRVSSDTID